MGSYTFKPIEGRSAAWKDYLLKWKKKSFLLLVLISCLINFLKSSFIIKLEWLVSYFMFKPFHQV